MKVRIAFAFLTTLFFALAPAQLQAAEETPEALLKKTVDQVVDILHEGDASSIEDKRARILDLLQSRFSFDIIIRRALGRNWNEFNEEQQNRVTQLISDLLIRSYTRELKNGPKPNITFVGTDDLSDNKIEIKSTVTFRDNLVAVNYRLANIRNRGWQVYDVLIEGVSMVSNYRKQFDEHFQTKSASDLLKLLQSKLDSFDT
ncbi:ABC transporter substrate-binding protein [Pelagicoccus sp. SDUM812003]|uniref:MlaC/ttg2D family ABC transporter substrate-binding protein n=1 Tax=Pelagicoccus sp. SDUM812003 TaxID=3041267 RepID=UPI00280D03FF|nr:ABC transporter substrate-binding protein [Pelagicoccus sp. SDUM812003]MDQ8205347.1 ABC transporter substrate-binding protein [Pelagicoccus sp. SDUM812003]